MEEDFLSKQFNNNLDALLDVNRLLDVQDLKRNEMLKFSQKIKSLDLSYESSIKQSLKKKLLILIDEKEKQANSSRKELKADELSTDQLAYVAGGLSIKGAKFTKNQLNILINEARDK